MWIKTQDQMLLNVNNSLCIYIQKNRKDDLYTLRHGYFNSDLNAILYGGTLEQVTKKFYKICTELTNIDLNEE